MPKSCQLVLFSATFPDHVREFASRLAPSANEIRLKQEELSVDAIKQFYMDCKNEDHKYEVLVELYNILTIGQSIIFCAKRETADQIAKKMTAEGHKIDSLHGKLDVKERDQTIDNFRSGKAKVLISTNVIARGIDISQVTLVINYDMPVTQQGEADAETYLHRIGRTGRFGRKGVSINFVHDQKSWSYMSQIEKMLHCSIVRVQTEDSEEMERTIKDGEWAVDARKTSLETLTEGRFYSNEVIERQMRIYFYRSSMCCLTLLFAIMNHIITLRCPSCTEGRLQMACCLPNQKMIKLVGRSFSTGGSGLAKFILPVQLATNHSSLLFLDLTCPADRPSRSLYS